MSYREALLELLGGRCSVCERTVDLHVDHIVPVSRGGSNHAENLRLLCVSCHFERHRYDRGPVPPKRQ